jgi:rhamnulokinase
MERVFGAVDLGASGGRVAAGVVAQGRCTLHIVHRFANFPILRSGRLRWDWSKISSEIVRGLRVLSREFPHVESIGVDGWGVDFAMLDDEGTLLADPVSYRDDRSASFVDTVHAAIGRDELFAHNGLQFLPFTSLYQLAAARIDPHWERVAHVVLLPDLVGYWLTGVLGTEVTNASTTGLLDARTGRWSEPILAAVGLEPDVFPPLRNPGERLGSIGAQLAVETGLSAAVDVTTVASHDTASAVIAVPAEETEFVYVSSGTWSLVGTELENPVLSNDAMAANFTNERGLDGTIRFLRNVGGLWLLQECLRSWSAEGVRVELAPLLEAAAEAGAGPRIDVDDPGWISPGDMPTRIRAAVSGAHQVPPQTRAATVRCILDSLAMAYGSATNRCLELTGRTVQRVHVVGGGSQNGLLCQLTADATGYTVVAGPAEATALGNVLVQARARGAVPEDLGLLRQELAQNQELALFRPRPVHAVRAAT